MDVRRKLAADGIGVARVTEFASMARHTGNGATRLVQVHAAEPAFPFYGTTYSQMHVYANGLITFDTAATGCTFTNQTIPTAAGASAIVAPFWDDLDLTTQGELDTQVMPNGDVIVQWTDAGKFFSSTDHFTFQVVLSPSGAIRFEYGTMTGSLTSAKSLSASCCASAVRTPFAATACSSVST